MSKLSIFIFVFVFTVNLPVICFSQQEATTYHWFCVTAKLPSASAHRGANIKLSNVESNIGSGTFTDFVATHNNGLQIGKITIGPFSTRDDAIHARNLYKNVGRNSANIDSDNELYFFFVKPVESENASTIKFENIPARVTSGSDNIFSAIMSEGLAFERFAIGPFPQYELAEKSKYTFLKNGRLFADTTTDSIRNVQLKLMARRWEKLKLSISPKTHNKELEKTICRFSTRFPRHYFSPNAVQVLIISATYKQAHENSVIGTSLQGSDVLDNNRVIAFDMATTYVELLYFDYIKNNKITGFIIDSFIYDDTQIIELPSKFIKLRK